MTTYDIRESSVEDSRPVEVYEFSAGTQTWRYTSRASDVTLGSDTYTKESIKRSQIGEGADARSRNVTLTVPASNAFASRYILGAPGNRATCSVIRLQRDEVPSFDTQILIFKGFVQTVRFVNDGRVAEIILRSLASAQNQSVPRYTFMSQCNHFLYDERCKVDPTSFNIIGRCTAGGDGTVLTVTGADGEADGYWNAGFVQTTAGLVEPRGIIAHTGTSITINQPFSTDVTGTDVQVFAGCDHIISGDCATKFANTLNFGGFPFVPGRNPFESGLI